MNKKIKILTYNLGYGHYNDQFYYGLKINKKTILDNINNQIKIIKDAKADIVLVQESNKLVINKKVNLYKIMTKELSTYYSYYLSNYNFLNIINIGKSTYTKNPANNYSIFIPTRVNKKVHNNYTQNKGIIITHLSFLNKKIVIFNVHLIAYKANAEIRKEQFEFIITQAQNEVTLGNYVIIGGDFNYNSEQLITELKKLGNTDFKVVFPDQPTYRSCKTIYNNNCNFSIIDGFICSNNINVVNIKSLNNFKASDHSPVIIEIELSN